MIIHKQMLLSKSKFNLGRFTGLYSQHDDVRALLYYLCDNLKASMLFHRLLTGLCTSSFVDVKHPAVSQFEFTRLYDLVDKTSRCYLSAMRRNVFQILARPTCLI